MAVRAAWGRIFRVAASIGFAASAVLHLATFAPIPAVPVALAALLLFAVALGLLGAMIVRLREGGAPTRGRGRVHVVEWRRLLALVPSGPRHAGFAVIGYVVLNLVLFMSVGAAAGGVRLLSGDLLLFYLIPLMYFRFVEPRLHGGDGWSDP